MRQEGKSSEWMGLSVLVLRSCLCQVHPPWHHGPGDYDQIRQEFGDTASGAATDGGHFWLGKNRKWIDRHGLIPRRDVWKSEVTYIQLWVVESNLINTRIYHLLSEVFLVMRLPRLMLHLPLFELSFHSPVDTYHEEPTPIGGSWLLDVHKIWGMYRSMPAPWSWWSSDPQ